MPSVKVSFQGKDKNVTIPEGLSIKDLLKKLEINREAVIVSRNREIVPDTETISDKDRIDIVRITSGG